MKSHSVVSWLMLEKDELVRELILLLLRSLKEEWTVKRRRGHRVNVRANSEAVRKALTPAAGI